tara:strand:+ start:20 stop:919 length:900 start_codon:yes stop_codon:yes gene_type:complete
MSKLIVIGNGYIGEKIKKQLSSRVDEITVLSGLNYNKPEQLLEEFNSILGPEIRYAAGPGFKDPLERAWVINCVGYTGKPNVDACEDEKEKCWQLNVTFPTLLASYCLRSNVKLINVSSGCIYDGTNNYEEEDWPDFGVDSPNSSWYSRTKHAAELSLNAFPNVYTLRVRMPICNDFNSGKNYLTKLLKYNNLLEDTNSKTIIEDLINVIHKVTNLPELPPGTYNCVNPEPLSTKEVTKILDKAGMWNPHWKFIDYKELKNHIKANRSNCKLSTEKSRLYNIEMPTERESLERILFNEE